MEYAIQLSEHDLAALEQHIDDVDALDTSDTEEELF